MESVLLHICCGICSSWAVERLKEDGFGVTGFFYNPNIQPENEYLKRLEVAGKVADLLKIRFVEGSYDSEKWAESVKGFEDEPEGGKRCPLCFKMRLEKSFKMAKELEADYFATTLSISPHKNTDIINQTGKVVGGEFFLGYDFKQQGGFKKANTFSKEQKLYRQNYCGCVFGKRK